MMTIHSKKTLSQWLTYIASIHVSAIDMGLERVLPVAKKLNLLKQQLNQNPANKTPYIFTVAGTNGKGSTTATIAQICQTAGYKTALYQSPHLVDFTERVRIDGKQVDEPCLIDAFEVVEKARLELGLSLSFFEMTTLAAFWIFQQANCDVWVLEIGLGGRLDVVNIIDPDVAVITNIALDHIDWLGDDIEKIGYEKAGIIRPNIPVILGSKQMPQSVMDIAHQYSQEVFQLGVDYAYLEQDLDWVYSNAALTLNLEKPNLSIQNAATAISAVLASQLKISVPILQQALKKVSLAGRFDRRHLANRHWVFDVAHNKAGIDFLLSQWQEYWQKHLTQYPDAKLHVVFSMLGDKDVGSVLQSVQQSMHQNQLPALIWHISGIGHERAMPSDALITLVKTHIKNPALHTYDTLHQATMGVIQQTQADDLIVVFGSFHTIGECLVALLGKNF